MTGLENMEPKKVFCFFQDLCQIPHGTFDTKRISDYCVDFAKKRNLEVIQDELNNIIIKKPGFQGYDDCEPVILQGHLDMVCEKKPESSHDFQTDGLKLYVENGFLKARDTTLGGDDGIAIAMALAILDSNDIPHPPIEALFTVDEEVGMSGAKTVDLSLLKGRMLLNIDSEEEGILTVGCAGGIRYESKLPVVRESKNGNQITIRIHGLKGGHSGCEIHKQRGNAHKMMGRLLYQITETIPINLITIFGGTKDNVIALESEAEILAPEDKTEQIFSMAREMKQIWDQEFMGEEPDLKVDLKTCGKMTAHTCDRASTDSIIGYLMLCPDGLLEYSRRLKGVAETSLNIGIVGTDEDGVRLVHLIRSSVESRKWQVRQQLEQCARICGGWGEIRSEYPAWQHNPDSKLCKVMTDVYREMFQKEPEISTIHAGLECGLFLEKRPDLDCVSFGPNILDVHSFHESLDIASAQRMWEYLKAVLKHLK